MDTVHGAVGCNDNRGKRHCYLEIPNNKSPINRDKQNTNATLRPDETIKTGTKWVLRTLTGGSAAASNNLCVFVIPHTIKIGAQQRRTTGARSRSAMAGFIP